jgi:hypothetical protein
MGLEAPTGAQAGWPIRRVNIYQAMMFCNKLTQLENPNDTFYTYSSVELNGYLVDFDVVEDSTGLDALGNTIYRNGYRLPTGFEWEAAYAEKAGGFFWEGAGSLASSYVHINSDEIISVGSLEPSESGLFDLGGNVSEWVFEHNTKIGDYTRFYTYGGNYLSTTVDKVLPMPTVNAILGTKKNPELGFRILKVK